MVLLSGWVVDPGAVMASEYPVWCFILRTHWHNDTRVHVQVQSADEQNGNLEAKYSLQIS